MKKIVYIGQFHLPDKDVLANRVVACCKAISKIGYEPVMIGVNAFQSNAVSDKHVYFGFTSYDVCYQKGTLSYFKNMNCFKIINKILKQKIGVETIAAVVLSDMDMMMNKAGIIRFCKRNGIKVIMDCVHWYDTAHGNFLERKVDTLRAYINNKILVQKVHYIICATEFISNCFYKAGCKTVVIPSLNPQEKTDTQIPYTPNKTRKIVYAGLWKYAQDYDRVDFIVKAAASFSGKDFVIKIIGLTKQEYIKKYPETEAIIFRMKDRIEFCGRLPYAVSVQYIRDADFVASARTQCESANAGLFGEYTESGFYGVPVITTPTGDIKGYVLSGENGILSVSCGINDYIEAFAQALRMTDTELEKMHEICAQRYTLNYLDWVNVFKTYFKQIKL